MANTTRVIRRGPAPIDARPNVYYSIDEIIIDMTGWANGDRSGIQRGIYPYCIRFSDSSQHMQSFYCEEQKSGGMEALYKYCNNTYNAVASYNTKITLICPQDVIIDRNSVSSRVHTADLSTYCEKAMDTIPFDVISNNNCKVRLESVLDYICHESTIDYIENPRTRKAVFEESIYDFEDEESRLYEERTEHPKRDERWFE